MIRVKLLRVNYTDNRVVLYENGTAGLISEGHAGLAEKGADIVCAAVSTLIQTAIVSIDRIAGVPQNITQNDGYLSSTFTINGLTVEERKSIEIIIHTMLLGLFEIRKQYPERLTIAL